MANKADAVQETQEKTQEMMYKGIASAEKAVEGMIELNAAMFKGGETLVKKMYENHVSNVAATFDGLKAMNKANDFGDFYKTATSTMASAAERYAEQSKSIVELSGKVLKDTGEVGRTAFSKTFSSAY